MCMIYVVTFLKIYCNSQCLCVRFLDLIASWNLNLDHKYDFLSVIFSGPQS